MEFRQLFNKEAIHNRREELRERSRREKVLGITIQACLAFALVFSVVSYAVYKEKGEDISLDIVKIVQIDIIPEDYSLEEKEELVYNSLIAAGYSPAGACGIMGNIAVESPEYDPKVKGAVGNTYGLFQWNNVGHRKYSMKKWCDDNGYGSDSIEGQLAFAVYELRGGDSIACRIDDFLRSTDDAYSAACEFAVGFERCIKDADGSQDKYMGSLYPEFYGKYYQALSKRINKAMNYYERFTLSPDDPENVGGEAPSSLPLE